MCPFSCSSIILGGIVSPTSRGHRRKRFRHGKGRRLRSSVPQNIRSVLTSSNIQGLTNGSRNQCRRVASRRILTPHVRVHPNALIMRANCHREKCGFRRRRRRMSTSCRRNLHMRMRENNCSTNRVHRRVVRQATSQVRRRTNGIRCQRITRLFLRLYSCQLLRRINRVVSLSTRSNLRVIRRFTRRHFRNFRRRKRRYSNNCTRCVLPRRIRMVLRNKHTILIKLRLPMCHVRAISRHSDRRSHRCHVRNFRNSIPPSAFVDVISVLSQCFYC